MIAISFALAGFGCATDRIDVNAKDRDRLTPDVKASIQILPRQEEPKRISMRS